MELPDRRHPGGRACALRDPRDAGCGGARRLGPRVTRSHDGVTFCPGAFHPWHCTPLRPISVCRAAVPPMPRAPLVGGPITPGAAPRGLFMFLGGHRALACPVGGPVTPRHPAQATMAIARRA